MATQFRFLSLCAFGLILAWAGSEAYALPGTPTTAAQVAAATAAQTSPNTHPMPGRSSVGNAPIIIPNAPSINAAAYILVDANTGNVVSAMNPDVKREPASLTKLMTMYVISQAIANGQIHLTDQVPISKKAWQTGGSKMFVRVGETVSVDDLVHGIIIDSGNDACVAMAEYVAGSEDAFVDLMNQQAALLGMKDTHFNDVNGLPSTNHYTTARDLSILARAIIENFPEDYKWYSEKWFTFNKIKQPNRNKLLWSTLGVDGMKTGFTDAAGYCYVSSAKQADTRLIAVILGAPSVNARFADASSLLTYGFRFFESHKLYTANQTLTNVRIWKGQTKQLPLGVANTLAVSIPRGQYSKLKAVLTINEPIMAPIAKGQTLGNIQILLNGKEIATEPLIALQADPKGGFWSRLIDSIRLWFAGKKDKS
jgi:D-alanyl-D-alanine carboxypeptidase (penicillin-binding protein 5/6)